MTRSLRAKRTRFTDNMKVGLNVYNDKDAIYEYTRAELPGESVDICLVGSCVEGYNPRSAIRF